MTVSTARRLWAAIPGEILEEIPLRVNYPNSVATDSTGLIVLGDLNGTVRALNPDLTTRWQVKPGQATEFGAPSIGPDGTIHVVSDDGVLYALSAEGAVQWQVEGLPLRHRWPPSIEGDGTLVVVGTGPQIYLFHPDGTLSRELNTVSRVSTAAAVGVDGTIYFGTEDNQFNAVSPEGHGQWRFTAGGLIQSHPAIGPDGTIYFGCNDRYLYAVSSSGLLQWRLQAGGFLTVVQAAPVIGPDCTIYVGCNDASFYAVRSDGTVKWKFLADGPVGTTATVATDGTVFFRSLQSLYALRPDGSVLWRLPGLGSPSGSSLLLPDGRLLVAPDGNKLVSVSTAQLPTALHWPTAFASPQRSGRRPNWLQLSDTNRPSAIIEGQSIVLPALWTLPGRALVRLELYAGTNRVAVSTNGALELIWTNALRGTNALFLRGWDSQGCVYRSDTVQLPVAPLALRLVAINAAQIRLQSPALLGRRYQLQMTTNLVDWTPVGLPAVSTTADLQWTVERPEGESGLRAFRISLEP